MAKHPHEIFQEAERAAELAELEEILKKPELTPEEIWSIFPNTFYAWRKKYDYPRILSHFSQKLNRFDEWKKEFKFSDETLMDFGISNCINKNPSKDKRKFIIERTWGDDVTKSISYQNLDGKFYNLGPQTINHKVISTFTGYLDWCDTKKIQILPDRRDNSLLGYQTKTHVNSPAIIVEILNGLRLLKIGGIEVKPNQYGIIKPKYFEFVNAEYLKLSNTLHTSGAQLIFENSFVNDLTCENLDLGLVGLYNCHVGKLKAINTTMQQWSFIGSNTSGKAYNSDLRLVSIHGGSFDVDFKQCTFSSVDARQSSESDLELESTYRTFKKIYADQGEDRKAIEYFLLEKTVERKKIRKQILNYRYWGFFHQTKKEKAIAVTKHFCTHLLRYCGHVINNYYWGYGRKPLRVVRNSVLFIFIFALVYFVFQANMNIPANQTSMSFIDSLYYSTVTFTTLGYGDFSPLAELRIAAATEAFLGGISLGFLVAGFSNFKY